ncbi:hypothetical protein HHK36_017565 [Tetracentron sinense]|uniref:Uncharacterized protein n=1 Tax=Tetracentron sinense TaxID=13715 RepID=A0A834YYE3_TETSI|nr:hypothetical protein HHK36_017565 [Tetracentron sinense]
MGEDEVAGDSVEEMELVKVTSRSLNKGGMPHEVTRDVKEDVVEVSLLRGFLFLFRLHPNGEHRLVGALSNDVSLEVTIGPVFQHSANYSEEEIGFDLDISEYEAVKEFYVCVSDEPMIQTNIPNRLENQLLTGEYDSPSSEWEHILTEDTWICVALKFSYLYMGQIISILIGFANIEVGDIAKPILGSLCSSEKVSFLLPSLGDREWPHRQDKHGVMDSKGIFRSIPGKGLGHVNLGARLAEFGTQESWPF